MLPGTIMSIVSISTLAGLHRFFIGKFGFGIVACFVNQTRLFTVIK
jgi:TM2 domain-containing membrane protein YozV